MFDIDTLGLIPQFQMKQCLLICKYTHSLNYPRLPKLQSDKTPPTWWTAYNTADQLIPGVPRGQYYKQVLNISKRDKCSF